ncbi:hypothetical protein QJS04_geneDACA017045 [Acorus gramineus]|uniref:Uncharacterized protein n=1 Tax=Acorus gramineus TaxID=55184 RepID=A0AAV9AKN4_ACOGR|nr:hypothetical protein QJS04_geneDACA017045 [Acorus gramineus]
MCPLRIILIFLSATIAGFVVLRNLNSDKDVDDFGVPSGAAGEDSVAGSTKVRSAMRKGFWACVDMASGKYLWRLLSSPSKEH